MNRITNNINIQDKLEKIQKTLNNTEKIGNSTLLELNIQGEQIKTIDKKSNILIEQLKITQNKLNNILSSFKLLFHHLHKPKGVGMAFVLVWVD